jgi:DNA-binding SARP family transcriptional activator/predicted negative regulator of RcsB-dependent stress response
MTVGQFIGNGLRYPNPLSNPQPVKLADSPIAPLTIYTLGRFAVYRGSELINDSAWKRRKARSLFKLLLLAPQGQLLKERVLEWLWPDQNPERAANNLHRTLFILRRVLEPELVNAADSHYIFFRDGKLALNLEAIAWTDVLEFDRLIQLGRQQPNPLPHYEAARSLYQGDFLPEDLYEDWASDHRQRYHSAYCVLVRHMAQLYAQTAAYTEAINCWKNLLCLDPTHEESYQELMRLYTQVGQRHQALQLYQQLCQILHRELEVEPAAETTALYQAIAENRWQPSPKPVPISALTTKPARWLETPQRRPLVGRDAELRQLTELIQQAEAGHGQVVLLCGEQGVGKSRLAEEALLRAQAGGLRVLYGAAYEQEGHLPYGPFVEAIRSGLTGQAHQTLREKLGNLSQDLARLLPELAEASHPSTNALEPELGQERQRLFDAVAVALIAFAQDAGLIMFLDDLHAAGESSLQLLHYLARRIANTPILILCTIREEKAQRGSPIARLCSELLNHCLGQRLDLSLLNPFEAAQFCSSLLGAGLLAPDLTEAIFYLTEGNPFFIQEIVLALRETGRIEHANGCWRFAAGLVGYGQKLTRGSEFIIPASVREVIRLHLARLSAEAYRLAGLAAVIGREFSYALLHTASQLDNAAQLDLLEEMLAAYLIEETGAGYRFRHGLLRQVLYDELTLHRRIWLHGQVAQALERLYVNQLDEQAAIFVYHYERAERHETTFHYLIRAGDRAQATYAPREAMDYYNRAVALCQQHHELATAETMAGLLQRRAQTHLTLSDFEAAIMDLEQLLENNRRTNDRLREGEALYQVGIAHYWAHRLERAAAYLDQAIQLAERLHYDELQGKALKLRDILNSTQGEVTQVKALEKVRPREGAQILPAEEHWGLAMLAHLHSDFDTALHHGQACVELGQSLSNPFLALGGYFVVGMSYASLGHYQLALDHLRHALDLSQAAEDRFWRARLLNTAGWVYREVFDVEQAIQFDQASLELARAGQPCLTEAEGNALANLATDYLLLGDFDRARAFLDEGLTGSGDKPFMRWRYRTRMVVIKGRLALAEGDVLGALAAADESLALTRTTHARKNMVRSCKLRGEALLAAGRIHKARAALSHALDISLSVKSPVLSWPCYLTLAHLEELADRPDVAKTHYFCAAQILNDVAARLSDPALRRSLLTAQPVQTIFEKAICTVPFERLEV